MAPRYNRWAHSQEQEWAWLKYHVIGLKPRGLADDSEPHHSTDISITLSMLEV
jgi:hypothetical protein